jgi:hypothetical protein
MLSAYETPEIRNLFNRSLKNVSGKLRTERRWSPLTVPDGINQVYKIYWFIYIWVLNNNTSRNSSSLTVQALPTR